MEKRREWSSSLPSQGLVFKRSTSKSNWNLKVLLFVEGGKPGNPETKPSELGTNNKLHETASTGIRTRVTEVGGEFISIAPPMPPHG